MNTVRFAWLATVLLALNLVAAILFSNVILEQHKDIQTLTAEMCGVQTDTHYDRALLDLRTHHFVLIDSVQMSQEQKMASMERREKFMLRSLRGISNLARTYLPRADSTLSNVGGLLITNLGQDTVYLVRIPGMDNKLDSLLRLRRAP